MIDRSPERPRNPMLSPLDPPGKTTAFLVRLGSDLTIKSDRVRAQMLGKLYRNIQNHLREPRIQGAVQVQKKWSRIYVQGQDPGISRALSEIFGVHSIQPILKQIPCHWEEILEQSIPCYRPLIEGKGFVVRVRRTGQHSFRSEDLERELGARLLKASPKSHVDLHHPQVTVSLEIRENDVFLLGEQMPGPSGLPIGAGGKSLALISGGFDSLVASWCAHKRGLELDFLFFNLDAGSLVKSNLRENLYHFHQRWSTGSRSRLIIVDFKPVVEEIQKKVRPALRQVVLKRFFYRGATYFAKSLGLPALVTGENIGQVSSQTLQNLVATEHVLGSSDPAAALISGVFPPEGTDRPIVLRPLLTAEKDEIIRLAKHLGTYEGSCRMPELCQLSQERPATHVSPAKAWDAEKNLDFSILMAALRQAHISLVRDWSSPPDSSSLAHLPNSAGGGSLSIGEDHALHSPPVSGVKPSEILVDIRDEEDFRQGHLPQAIHIPSYVLESETPPLQRDLSYVLYCQKGLLSGLIAQALLQRGYRVKSLKKGFINQVLK
jgi:thiamine biosynthesis protein ThiI